jgi:hypothetical protein
MNVAGVFTREAGDHVDLNKLLNPVCSARYSSSAACMRALAIVWYAVRVLRIQDDLSFSVSEQCGTLPSPIALLIAQTNRRCFDPTVIH